MAISFTSPGTLFKLIATATGTTGASAGGWYAWDFKNPTAQSLLEGEYELSPKKLELLEISTRNQNSISKNKYSIKTDLCFKNFLYNADAIEFNYRNDIYSGFPFLNPKESEHSSKIEGCTMMKYFTSEDNDKWSFESETVIRNDKIGIAVWVEANNESHVLNDGTTTRSLIYNVLLFEKEKSNNWKVKEGFVSSTIFGLDDKGEIKSPDNYIKGVYSKAKSKSIPKKDLTNKKYYSGILEKSKDKEIELFENVFQLVDKTKFEATTEEQKIFSTYTYLGETEEKVAITRDRDVTNKNLQSWYSPFSGKKEVKWSTFEEYCSRESDKRNINKEAKNLLINLCYQKKLT